MVHGAESLGGMRGESFQKLIFFSAKIMTEVLIEHVYDPLQQKSTLILLLLVSDLQALEAYQ